MPITLKPGLRLRKMGRRYMIVRSVDGSVDFAEVYTLNETAAFLWKKASEKGTFEVDQAVAWLLEEYEVDRETVEADVLETVALWKEYGIAE